MVSMFLPAVGCENTESATGKPGFVETSSRLVAWISTDMS